MGNSPGAPAQPPPTSPLGPEGAAVDGVVNEVARRPTAERGEGGASGISSSEDIFLLPPALLNILKPPLAALGYPIEDQPASMFEYDPANFFYFYRIPIQGGYIALLYLRNRLTETYMPGSNLSVLYDWLVDLNPDLEIRAVLFFTDGERVDSPYQTMAHTWKRRGVLHVVEYLLKPFTDGLERMRDQAQARIMVQRNLQAYNLQPRQAQPPAAQPVPPQPTAQDLKRDQTRDLLGKDEIEAALDTLSELDADFAIMQKSRFNRAKNSYKNGESSEKDFNVECSLIIKAVLEFLG